MIKSRLLVSKSEINSLVKRIGNGDWDAFKELNNKMYKILYKFLYKYCFDKEIVKDIISNTFYIVIEKSKNKMFYINCFSWIITIAKNQMLNYIKENKKYVYTDKIELVGEENHLITKLSLKQAFEKLSKKEKHLLYLLYCENLKYKEICKILNTSIPTIKRRKKEILDLLKEQVENEEN